MQLEPCAKCKRHVAVDATACPFCSAPIVASPPRPALVGRWSRAAIFAGATTLTACYTSSTGTSNTQQIENTKTPEPTKVAPPAEGTGTIHGVLVNQNGALLANMPIELANAETSAEQRSATTDARGEFVFADLPPGSYRIIYENSYNPRQGPNMGYVEVKAGEIAETKGIIYPQPVDTGPCCKPYGAPPARRRVV